VVEWAIGLPIASKEGPNSTAANLCTTLWLNIAVTYTTLGVISSKRRF
jgi:hypothetical protein